MTSVRRPRRAAGIVPAPAADRRRVPAALAAIAAVGTMALIAVTIVGAGWTVHRKAAAMAGDRARVGALHDAQVSGLRLDGLFSLLPTDAAGVTSASFHRSLIALEMALDRLGEANGTDAVRRAQLADLRSHLEQVREEQWGLADATDPASLQYRLSRLESQIDHLVAELDSQARTAQREFDLAVAELVDADALAIRLIVAVTIVGLGVLGLLGWLLVRYRRIVARETTHDTLTGLPNRNLLLDRADHALAIARRTATSTAMLVIDLDRFADVNESFGSQAGDRVLRELAERFVGTLRDADTVGRLGSDEYGVLLTNLSGPEAALRVADALSQIVREPIDVDGTAFELEARIGVVLAPDQASSADELLQRAGLALQVAKHSHVDVAMYERESEQQLPTRLLMLGELRRSIEQGELRLYYQPKNSLPHGTVAGAEALVRWEHPQRGTVPPGEFIPLAERSSLIEPLTTWVLRTALEQLHTWMQEGRAVPVAVNVSARSLMDDQFPHHVAALLERTGVPAHLLEIEVTETAVVAEPLQARRILQALSDLGVSIAIDDFGSGYTSLSYLRTLPVDSLKIDRSFVAKMRESADDAAIVRNVINLGRDLGLNVVAEGVEDADTCDDLVAAGCPHAQGYWWARPRPAEDCDWLPVSVDEH